MIRLFASDASHVGQLDDKQYLLAGSLAIVLQRNGALVKKLPCESSAQDGYKIIQCMDYFLLIRKRRDVRRFPDDEFVDVSEEGCYLLSEGGAAKGGMVGFNRPSWKGEKQEELWLMDVSKLSMCRLRLGNGKAFFTADSLVMMDYLNGGLALYRKQKDEYVEQWKYSYEKGKETDYIYDNKLIFLAGYVVVLEGFYGRDRGSSRKYSWPPNDAVISLLDIETGERLHQWRFPHYVLRFGVDDESLYVPQKDTLHKIDLESGQEMAQFTLDPDRVRDAEAPLNDGQVFVADDRVYFYGSEAGILVVLNPDLQTVLATIRLPDIYGFDRRSQPQLVGDYVWFVLTGAERFHWGTGGMLQVPRHGPLSDAAPPPYEGLEFREEFVEEGNSEYLVVHCEGDNADDLIRIGDIYLRRAITEHCRGILDHGRQRKRFNGLIHYHMTGLDEAGKQRVEELSEVFAERMHDFAHSSDIFKAATKEPIRLVCKVTEPPEMSSSPASVPQQPKQREDSFIDIPLLIQEHHIYSGGKGELQLIVAGDIQGVDVGFELKLGQWQASHDKESGLTLYFGEGTFLRLGKASDRFVSQLAKAYGVESSFSAKDIVVTPVVCFDNNPAEADTTPLSLKFCFEDSAKDVYCEVFINVDLPNGALIIKEKAVEYRLPLLHALGD
jgi:hypothetical protein